MLKTKQTNKQKKRKTRKPIKMCISINVFYIYNSVKYKQTEQTN